MNPYWCFFILRIFLLFFFYPAPSPHDVDVDGLRQQSGALADRIEAGGLTGLDTHLMLTR